MNSTAMVSVDTTGAAGKVRSATGSGEAGPRENAFAGLMSTSPAPVTADAGGSDAAAEAAEPGAESQDGRLDDLADRDPGSEPEDGTCSAQVLALLGLAPPPNSQAVADHLTPPSELCPVGADPRAAAPADGTVALADTWANILRGAEPGRDTHRGFRGDARGDGRGSETKALEAAAAILLAGTPEGLDTRPTDGAAGQSPPEVPSMTLGEAQRSRAASIPVASPPGGAGSTLQQPVGSQGWNDELGARLAMMVDRGEQLATLQLTPDELGPVEVRLALREGEATVLFTAQAGETRAALEQALPRLRELFASGGLALAHAAVQGETSRDPQRFTAPGSLSRSRREAGQEPDAPLATGVTLRRGLLDLYA